MFVFVCVYTRSCTPFFFMHTQRVHTDSYNHTLAEKGRERGGEREGEIKKKEKKKEKKKKKKKEAKAPSGTWERCIPDRQTDRQTEGL